MKLFQKHQNTIGYNSIPNAIAADDDETAAVPLGTPPPTKMTMGRRSSWLLAIVAGMIMMILVVAGGTVWILETTDGGLTTAAEGLVVATTEAKSYSDGLCSPAGGTFGRVSTTITLGIGKSDHFETCYQYGSSGKYCWTKSWYSSGGFLGMGDGWYQCMPNPPDSAWDSAEPYGGVWCGTPCQGQFAFN